MHYFLSRSDCKELSVSVQILAPPCGHKRWRHQRLLLFVPGNANELHFDRKGNATITGTVIARTKSWNPLWSVCGQRLRELCTATSRFESMMSTCCRRVTTRRIVTVKILQQALARWQRAGGKHRRPKITTTQFHKQFQVPQSHFDRASCGKKKKDNKS